MLRKLIMMFGGALSLAILFVGPTSNVHAATDGLSVSGTINTIDLKTKQINIKKGDGTTITLNVNSNTTILRNSATSTLKGLALRDNITAKYNGTSMHASKLTATGQAVKRSSGPVQKAQKGSGVVTVGTKNIQTNANTKISRNGKVVSLSQVTTHDTLTAHLQPGTNVALDLVDDGPEEGDVSGSITAINGNDVTITPENGSPAVTVHVDSNTQIEANGEDATLADLVVGQMAESEYDPTTFVAFSIEADSEGDEAHVSGTVGAVDTTNSTITINPTAGSPVTLNVDASTEIKVNDEDATLADVQVGMPVQAEYDTATMLAKQIDAGSGDDNEEDQHVSGTVAAVDTTAGTVSITPDGGGSNIVLKVDSDTDIEVNGDDAALNDITVGASIEAEYNPTTMLASELKVGDEGDDAPSK